MNIRRFVKRIPILEKIAIYCYSRFKPFPGSVNYWERQYSIGRDSGPGSRGKLAAFKADFINSFIKENNIESIIEFGCGDGSQLSLINYPKYIGLDVSETAIQLCQKRFPFDNTKKFFIINPMSPQNYPNLPLSDLSISLDVIYHLIEDDMFHQHMSVLFRYSKKFVLIYSNNYDESQHYQIKSREFTKWIDKHASHWKLVVKIENPYPYNSSDPDNSSLSDFYIYKKNK